MPGPIGAAVSAGANALIASGAANALTGAPMLLGALGARAEPSAREDDGLAARVLDALAAAPADPDALARRFGVPMSEMAAAIARLLIRGRVASDADGRIVRC